MECICECVCVFHIKTTCKEVRISTTYNNTIPIPGYDCNKPTSTCAKIGMSEIPDITQ